MKRIICLCMALLIMCSVPAFAAGNQISVTVNGRAVSFDQPPIIQNNRTLVPMRAIFEALGYEVEWDDGDINVFDDDGNLVMWLTVDDDEMHVMGNGKFTSVWLDVPPQIIGGRTLVPVRAISESIGAEVGWNNSSKTVTVAYSGSSECTHKKTQEVCMIDLREWEQNGSEDTHNVIDTMQSRCLDCGKTLKTYEREYEDSHNFKNGVCSACGYSQACKHKSTREVISIDERQYKQNGSADTHIAIEKVIVYCNNCGEAVSTKNKNVTMAHDFEDGFCTDCGYKQPKAIVSPGSLDIEDDGDFKSVTLQSGESLVVANSADNKISIRIDGGKGYEFNYVIYDKDDNASAHYNKNVASIAIKSGETMGIYNTGDAAITLKAASALFYPTDEEEAFVIKAITPGKSCKIKNNTEKKIVLGIYGEKGYKYDYVLYDKSGNVTKTLYEKNASSYGLNSGEAISVSNSGEKTIYFWCPARVANFN